MTIDEVFAALSDPTRRMVMERLSISGGASATELAGDLPVSRQAVVKHLLALNEAGLVLGERAGRQKKYRLTPEPMADAVGWMTEVGGHWDARLESLRQKVTEEPDAK